MDKHKEYRTQVGVSKKEIYRQVTDRFRVMYYKSLENVKLGTLKAV